MTAGSWRAVHARSEGHPGASLVAEHESLRSIAEAVARRVETNELCALVVCELGVPFAADAAVIVRIDASDEQARVVGAWDAERGPVARLGERVDLEGPGSLQEAIRTAAPARLRHGLPSAHGAGLIECIAVPIVVGGRTWGAVSIGTRSPKPFPPDAEQRLVRHTSLIAIAIAEAEARGDSLHRFEQQRAISALGAFALGQAALGEVLQLAVDLAATTLHVETVGVGQLDADSDELELQAVYGPGALRGARMRASSKTLAGLALGSDAPVIANDLQHDPRFRDSTLLLDAGAGSAASTVIRSQEGNWGVITLISPGPGRFQHSDAQFLSQIADVLATAIDRTESERRIRHDATHDALTGLANRTLIADRISRAVERAHGASATIAVIVCDVDRLKVVNDLHGRVVGDRLIVEVAHRLRGAIGPAHSLGRLEGDEFVIVCENLTGEDDGLAVAQEVLRSFDDPFPIADGIHVSASVGVVVSGRRPTCDGLLRDAATARHRAKAAGRGGLEISNPAMRRRTREAAMLERDLSHAVERGELILRYQPIISMADGSIAAFEALLRWQHPTRGLLAPSRFIAIAEESRLIVPIGRWTISEAARAAHRWNLARPDEGPVGMNINISPLQLGDPTLVAHLEHTIQAFGCAPLQLGLEITETMLLDSSPAQVTILRAASAAGVRLLLDDFGIGYSSLASLQKLPLDALKLDRSFVTDVTSSDRDAAIVTAMVRMADELGIDVVAEGVETRLQHEKLKLLGCRHVQGYYYSRPLTPERAMALLAPGGSRVSRRAAAA